MLEEVEAMGEAEEGWAEVLPAESGLSSAMAVGRGAGRLCE